MDTLRISIVQTDIVWENKQENLRRIHRHLERLRGATEIVVLPEMFSTGFSMNASSLAEPTDGETIRTLQAWAGEYQTAIAGSYMASHSEGDVTTYRNRGFFLTPEGESFFYDKHHLFRMGSESCVFSPGEERPIIHYRGWNILLLICYDLRFPVWSRNVDNEYDLLIYVANWPSSRRLVWDTLLQARALENMCYVCGVNRIGTDGNDLPHNGGSVVYTPKGKCLASATDNEEGAITVTLSLPDLKDFREKFPAWKDADAFSFQASE